MLIDGVGFYLKPLNWFDSNHRFISKYFSFQAAQLLNTTHVQPSHPESEQGFSLTLQLPK